MARLERLIGLDDELDVLIERARGEAGIAGVMTDVQARLVQLG